MARTQLLKNNGFESNGAIDGSVQAVADLTDWTTANGSTSFRVGRNLPGSPAAEGDSFLELNYALGARGVKQSLTTEVGKTYMIELDVAALSRPTVRTLRDIEIVWAGQRAGLLSSRSTDWETIRFEITGVGGAADLVFQIRDGKTGSLRIDNVAVFEKPAVGDDLRITGTSGADALVGDVYDDTIHGLGGNDVLEGGRGRDAVFGDDGADTIYGQHGNDTLHGGADIDILYGGNGRDWVFGGAGADTLYGDTEADSMNGGADADLLYGGTGNDTIKGGNDFDTVYGGDGNDVIYGGSGRDEVYGEEGDDHLIGENGSDNLYGGAGNDTLTGGEDNTGFFSNNLYGGDGDDVFYGGLEAERFYGGDGFDVLSYVKATAGVRVDLTNASNGQLNALNDTAESIELVEGSKFDDFIFGTVGPNNLAGLAGNDTLQGANADDTLNGGDGNDLFQAGLGDNRMTGGAGNDVFEYRTVNSNSDDTITDFTRGEDKIYIEGGSLSEITQTQLNGATILEFSVGTGTTRLTLENIASNLTVSDFIF